MSAGWAPPGPISEAFYWCDDALIALRGPVGSGKTRTHMASRIRRAVMAPRSRIDFRRRYKVTFVRETYRQLWQTTIPSWFEVMPRKLGRWSGGRGDPVTHQVEIEDDYGLIDFVAEFLAFGDNPGEITANMRGVQTTDMAVEEGDTVDQTVYAVGIGRIDRYPSKEHFRGLPPQVASYGQMSATYNACEESNSIIGLFEPENAPDPKMTQRRVEMQREMDLLHEKGELARPFRISFFRQPGGREPDAENMTNLAPGYYANQVATMKAMGRSDEIVRLVDNKLGYIRQGDPVFEREFNAQIHVAREEFEPAPDEELIASFDQGFFGAGLILTFRRPFQFRVHAEFCEARRMFAESFAVEFREMVERLFPHHRITEAWGDMAGDKESAEAQENLTWNRIIGDELGVAVLGQTEGNNRIAPRLRAIRAGLDWVHYGQPGLLIHPRCRQLIRGFEAAYVWGEEIDKAGNKTTKPKKRGVRAADLMDALAHGMLSRSAPDGVTPVSTSAGRAKAHATGNNETAFEKREYRYDPFSLWESGP